MDFYLRAFIFASHNTQALQKAIRETPPCLSKRCEEHTKLFFRPEIELQLLDLTVRILVTAESSWYVMAHGDAREGKWRGNWRMESIASTLHTTSAHVVSIITTDDWHTSAASIRLNWRPRRFKWTRPFRRKAKYGFCACAITFQTQFTNYAILPPHDRNLSLQDKTNWIICQDSVPTAQ